MPSDQLASQPVLTNYRWARARRLWYRCSNSLRLHGKNKTLLNRFFIFIFIALIHQDCQVDTREQTREQVANTVPLLPDCLVVIIRPVSSQSRQHKPVRPELLAMLCTNPIYILAQCEHTHKMFQILWFTIVCLESERVLAAMNLHIVRVKLGNLVLDSLHPLGNNLKIMMFSITHTHTRTEPSSRA